ncbi:uncharacterized protein [Palaemon carinicauda]|uniref:uncharacterized protein n=1 Tax=Palaemon carinicauda TaxID=392227 RepID=UPI0035B6213D
MNSKQKFGFSSLERSIKNEIFGDHDLSESDGDDHVSSSDDDTDSSESSDNKEPSTLNNKQILHGIVSSPSDFKRVTDPGHLTHSNLSEEDNEYYIFRFPPGFLNPCDLVGNKVKVKNGTSQMINIGKNFYELYVHENSSHVETPAVFLPDRSGQLSQANLKISGHITMKKVPLAYSDAQEVNIDDLRTRSHQPPEIRQRVFFESPGSPNHLANYNSGTTPKLLGEKKHKSKKRKSALEKEAISATYPKDDFMSPLSENRRKSGTIKRESGSERTFEAAFPSLQRGDFDSEPSEEQKLEKQSRIKKETITPLKKSKIPKGFEKFSPLPSPNKKIKKEYDV